ncbi:hypothetical protein VNO77_28527 [Canavalia gladiata]|uniref:Late embryogenesis abundant protein LEA-2 subgroup domain-containing protein n=1 Tax=Canavalia gladiata TaxID=3824 RepID=A0AAN9L0F2_CANGL
MSSDPYAHQRYVSLQNQGYVSGPPPYGYGRKPPRYHHHSGSGCLCGCLKFFCCCFYSCCRCCICAFFIFILILVIIIMVLYYLLKPDIPSYNIQGIDINTFDLKIDNKLFSNISIVVKADNPNEGIGLNYLDNEVRLLYSGSQLCSGAFPPFLQPERNVTTFNVTLKGESEFGPEMQQHLMQEQDKGTIHLLIAVRLPIRLVVDDLIHLRKFVVNINCSMIIDHLEQNKKPNILRKDFIYGIEF